MSVLLAICRGNPFWGYHVFFSTTAAIIFLGGDRKVRDTWGMGDLQLENGMLCLATKL